MNSSKVTQSPEVIEGKLESKNREMEEFQLSSNYVDAEKCRIAIEQLKKDY
jgi:hypothetical protein